MHRQGFYGWFNKNLRGKKGQQGFTLIELLVVVTILGVLAAIVTLSLVGLTTHANEQACNQEYKTVQTALDSYLANSQVDTLAAQGSFTNDMTGSAGGAVKLYNLTPNSTTPNYTRNGTTVFFYKWNLNGQITAIAADAGGTAVPNCVPH